MNNTDRKRCRASAFHTESSSFLRRPDLGPRDYHPRAPGRRMRLPRSRRPWSLDHRELPALLQAPRQRPPTGRVPDGQVCRPGTPARHQHDRESVCTPQFAVTFFSLCSSQGACGCIVEWSRGGEDDGVVVFRLCHNHERFVDRQGVGTRDKGGVTLLDLFTVMRFSGEQDKWW